MSKLEDKLEEKFKQLEEEAQKLWKDKNKQINVINGIDKRLVEIEGALKALTLVLYENKE